MCYRMNKSTKAPANNAEKETPTNPFKGILPDGDGMAADAEPELDGQSEAI